MSSPIQVDFLVVGSGLAGLTFALHAAEHGNVAVLTKANIFESNTSYAQGGIAAAVGESDSWQLHEQDTLTAGDGECDREAVKFLVQNAPAAIEWLAKLGVRFDRDHAPNSLTEWALGREGGHSRNRIVHHRDNTGWEIERAMTEAVRANPKISIYENAFVTKLIVEDGRCVGAECHIEELGFRRFFAPSTLIATGGCGRLYQHTTNPRIATGDGIGLASLAGAEIKDMHYMQFHPTTLYHPQMRSFLITEAVRGEGGTLRNHLGTRFMYDYDDRLELAPRDVVARAIHEEMHRLKTWCVYLDMTHLPKETSEEHFPNITAKLKEVGILPYKNWIPIVPAQHYSCGGIVTDLSGRSSIRSLYAAGEVARTGVHGANRLASNSLLEALVFAKHAALSAIGERPLNSVNGSEQIESSGIIEADAVRIRRDLEKTMTENVGIVRRTSGLQNAKQHIETLSKDYDSLPRAPFSTYSLEARNLLLAAKHVVADALDCKRNVGLHYCLDLIPASR